MWNFEDLTGQRFGKLTVLERASNGNHKQTRWLCRCDCGNERIVQARSLKSGNTKSCGCLQKEKTTTHGQARTRLYATWRSMRYRCSNPHHRSYKWYGGKGIKVCKEWDDSFDAFHDWAVSHGYTDNLTIDRIDASKDYEPSNCRWITMSEQQRNKETTHWLTYKGVAKPLITWIEEFGLNESTVRGRIAYGWTSPEEILFGKKKYITT